MEGFVRLMRLFIEKKQVLLYGLGLKSELCKHLQLVESCRIDQMYLLELSFLLGKKARRFPSASRESKGIAPSRPEPKHVQSNASESDRIIIIIIICGTCADESAVEGTAQSLLR